MKFYNREDFEKRNQPCECGSGKKFKLCCYKDGTEESTVIAKKPNTPKPKSAKAEKKLRA